MYSLTGRNLRDQVRRLIEGEVPHDDFSHLFVGLAAEQRNLSEVLGKYWRSLDTGKWETWSDVPPVPVSMFKYFDIRSYHPHSEEKVWLSSGTRGVQSRHFMLNTILYDIVSKKLWRENVPRIDGATYKLIPNSFKWPHSSLAHFFDILSVDDGGWWDVVEGEDKYFTVLFDDLIGILEAAEDSDEPVRLAGTSYAIASFFDHLEKINCRFVLNSRSQIVDTGGYKGLVRDRSRDEFIRQATELLTIHPMNCFNEYGMSEMTSHCWSTHVWRDFDDHEGEATGGDYFEWWRVPDWLKCRIVDPMTLKDDPNGVVAWYDLANVWSCCALLTEDLGRLVDIGGSQYFQPLGRAQGAELKGCSLAAERAMGVIESDQ